MLKLKKYRLLSVFSLILVSCDSTSDVIVNIYGAYEYNCTKDELRVLAKNPILPFMKKKKWYTRDEFHNSHIEHSLEPLKNLPMSDESLNKIRPKKEDSYAMLQELIQDVDCKNPKDIKF